MPYLTKRWTLAFGFFGMIASFLTGYLSAQSTTDWTGSAGNGLWTTSTNWEGNDVPNSLTEIPDFNPASFVTPGDQIVSIPALTNITVRQVRTTSSDDVTINGPGTLTFNSDGIGVGMAIADFAEAGGNLTFNTDVSVGFGSTLFIIGFSSSQSITFNGALDFGSQGLSDNSSAGQITINGSISGAGRLIASTSRLTTAVMTITAANSYTGNTLVQRGKLLASGNATFGDGTGLLQIFGPSSSFTPSLELSNLTTTTIPNNFTFSGPGEGGNGALQLSAGDATFTGTGTIAGNGGSTTSIVVASGSTLTFSNTISAGANNVIEFSGAGDVETSGSGAILQSSGTTFVTKEGAGTLTYGGAANTYVGLTTINGGDIVLNSTGNSIGNGGLTLNAGTSASLGQSNQVGDTARLTLNGATFNTNGFDESFGPLVLQVSSTFDMGSGDSVIVFQKNEILGWTAGQTLLVLNWSGNLSGGGTDQLFFGTDSTGLSASKLSQILFRNPDGLAIGDYSAQILGTGEVVPVPEPSTYALILGAAVIAYILYYRCRK
tara:strand:+ start:838 stop:2481 length:1644 start_codon:yes stop_codon:yes gene_type:complete